MQGLNPSTGHKINQRGCDIITEGQGKKKKLNSATQIGIYIFCFLFALFLSLLIVLPPQTEKYQGEMCLMC